MTSNNTKIINDFNGVCKQLNGELLKLNLQSDKFQKIDNIKLFNKPVIQPMVSNSGIERCLTLWRFGNTFYSNNNIFRFYKVTNKIEYIFSIEPKECNVYCGASINIAYNNGLFGGGQYF